MGIPAGLFCLFDSSGNVGEILGVGAAATVGLPLPLLPLQILYLNVLNDVFPALALEVGRGTKEAMDRPSPDPEEAVVTPFHWGLLGTFLTAMHGLGMGTTQAVSVSFLTLSISRLLHVFNMRRSESGLFDNEISRTPNVWSALGLCLSLLLLAIYWPPLASILSVMPPGLDGWLSSLVEQA